MGFCTNRSKWSFRDLVEMKIAILGWGSLLWEGGGKFDEHHEPWQFDGPSLELEFSRVSESRAGALTLVIDPENGVPITVAYCLSTRSEPDDAICDLRHREGTTRRNIGVANLSTGTAEGWNNESCSAILTWAIEKKIDVVVWTDLGSNFHQKVGQRFSAQSAIYYLQGLNSNGKAKAAEYVRRAPEFIKTPLRQALEGTPWFPSTSGKA